MAVSPHPSVRPSEPRKPPSVEPREGKSGQAGVSYGAEHKLHVKPSHKSEMAHHFHDHKSEEGGSAKGPYAKAGDKD